VVLEISASARNATVDYQQMARQRRTNRVAFGYSLCAIWAQYARDLVRNRDFRGFLKVRPKSVPARPGRNALSYTVDEAGFGEVWHLQAMRGLRINNGRSKPRW
jgi:hypothetical protein